MHRADQNAWFSQTVPIAIVQANPHMRAAVAIGLNALVIDQNNLTQGRVGGHELSGHGSLP